MSAPTFTVPPASTVMLLVVPMPLPPARLERKRFPTLTVPPSLTTKVAVVVPVPLSLLPMITSSDVVSVPPLATIRFPSSSTPTAVRWSVGTAEVTVTVLPPKLIRPWSAAPGTAVPAPLGFGPQPGLEPSVTLDQSPLPR